MSGREHTKKQGNFMKLTLALVVIVTLIAGAAVIGYVTAAHSGSSTAGSPSVNHRRSVDFDPENGASGPYAEPEVPREEIHARSRFTRQAQGLTRTSSGTHNPNFGQDMSCFTDPANNTIPAAHIKGHGHFKAPDGSSILPGYQQRWRCADYDPSRSHNPGQNTHAFVDGGMGFNQTEKKLIVPKCGYYHVFSQILFQYEKSGDSHTTIYHMLKFDRNCPSWEETPIAVMGRGNIRAGDTTTTHTSDVIKLCSGGKIWVEIPETQDRDSCFPKGDDHATFMGAVLVAETTCHWPPSTKMENVDHSHDE